MIKLSGKIGIKEKMGWVWVSLAKMSLKTYVHGGTDVCAPVGACNLSVYQL